MGVEQSMTLTLFRVQMQNKQSRQWYLSKMDPLKPGTNKDVDYYCCSSQTECPPKIGWRKIGNGRDPAPVSVRGNADMARRAELNQRSRGHSVSSDDSSGEEEYRGEEKWQDRSGGGDGRFPAAPSAPRVANICLPGDGVDPYPTSSDDVNSTEPAGSGSDDPNLDGFSDDEVAQNRDNVYSM